MLARAQTTYWIAVDGYKGGSGPQPPATTRSCGSCSGPTRRSPRTTTLPGRGRSTARPAPVTASNVLSTKQAGEPAHAGNAGGASVWFRWTAPADGPVYFDTPGSSFDTLLAVYTGSSLADLKEVAADDDIAYNTWWPDGRLPRELRELHRHQGHTYYIAVDGKATGGRRAGARLDLLDWWQIHLQRGQRLLAAGEIGNCGSTERRGDGAVLTQYPDADRAGARRPRQRHRVDERRSRTATTPSWGAAAKDRTHGRSRQPRLRPRPAAAPYYAYWGAKAGAAGAGYYSYDSAAGTSSP